MASICIKVSHFLFAAFLVGVESRADVHVSDIQRLEVLNETIELAAKQYLSVFRQP